MGQILSFAILIAGGIMTVRERFVQRHLGRAFVAIFKKESNEGEISAFGALCTTLAATLGTGNIVGVAGAVALGGPGALFWMLVSAFFAMALKYTECFLAAQTRRRTERGFDGGPYIYIKKILGSPFARLFALSGAAAGSISIGTTLQMDSVIGVLDPARRIGAFSSRSIVICTVTAILAGWVLWGGAKSIASFCEKVIPVMSVAYILCCFVILWNFKEMLPAALLSIIKGAFCPAAVLGGAAGSVIRTLSVGISRGIFSNEAGLGSAPIAAAAAGGDPHRQGLIAMSGVFIDTVVMCFLSGLCVVVTDAYVGGSGSDIVADVFCVGLGKWSVGLLSLFLCLFAFTTIVGWYFFAGACFRYFAGGRFEKVFRLFYISMLLLTPFVQSQRLWVLADALNVAMALPNLLALLLNGIFDEKCIDLVK